MSHLYETVIGNARVWLKLQASCESSEQAGAFFECRFNGNDFVVDGKLAVMPFRLSERSDHITNWASIADRLPAGWEDDEFRIVEPPYPWCESLSDGCNCHGRKGRLDEVVCSDVGLHEETDKRAGKSENVRHQRYIRWMEEAIARQDEAQSRKKREREQQRSHSGTRAVAAQPAGVGGRHPGAARSLDNAIGGLNRLVAGGFYCSIHGSHHPYGEQSVRNTVASVASTWAQISSWVDASRDFAMSRMGDMTAHWLQMHQSEECAQRSVWGDADIPEVLYKYIPKERIGNGAPNSLRATQLLALNDDMECNVTTMKGSEEEDTLAFLKAVQSELERHLGVAVDWEELLTRRTRYGDLRLSTFLQGYLNPRVGVVSFSTDVTVPTMWAHYARNTGIVVGYDRDALRARGFELRPVVYSELAPTYRPRDGDAIMLDFVNREYMERDLRAGRNNEDFPVLASTELARFGLDWKSLARVLLVKGISWAYEKEVRLLVDLDQTRDTGGEDDEGWPVKVIDLPPEAIRQIYPGVKTQEADVELAIQIARGEDRRGLFVGRLSSHAFRIQKTGGTNH